MEVSPKAHNLLGQWWYGCSKFQLAKYRLSYFGTTRCFESLSLQGTPSFHTNWWHVHSKDFKFDSCLTCHIFTFHILQTPSCPQSFHKNLSRFLPLSTCIYSPSMTTLSNCLKHLSLKTQVHREAQLQLGQRNTSQLAWAPQITISQPTNHWLHSHPFGECSTRCTPPWYRARNAKRSATSDPQVPSFKITHFARSSFNKKIEVIKVESMYFTNKTVSKTTRCSLHVLSDEAQNRMNINGCDFSTCGDVVFRGHSSHTHWELEGNCSSKVSECL